MGEDPVRWPVSCFLAVPILCSLPTAILAVRGGQGWRQWEHLFPTQQSPLSVPPAWQAGPDKWNLEGTAQRPARARSHKPQCLRPALGLSAGKAGGRGGDPKPSPPGQATPWHPQGGEGGAHTVSHEVSLPPLPGSSLPRPHGWVLGEGGGHPLCSLQPPHAPGGGSFGDPALSPRKSSQCLLLGNRLGTV